MARCMAEGQLSGHQCLIEADPNKQNSTQRENWDVPRSDPAGVPHAVRAYLETRDEAAFGTVDEARPKFTSHSDPASRLLRPVKGLPSKTIPTMP